MPPIPPENGYRWVTTTIHPPEADEIGRKLKLAGMALDSDAYHVGAIKSELEQCWSGRAQQRFFEDYGFARIPTRLEELGAAIQAHGDAVRGITVTVRERVPIDVKDNG